jgi:hypothetical protein
VAEKDSLAEESGESSDALSESCCHGGSAHGTPLAIVAIGAVGAEDLGEKPGLNSYQPHRRRKVPRTTWDVLWPQSATERPKWSNRLILGPSMKVPHKPAMPSTMRMTPEPTKSMTKVRNA